MDVSSTSAGRVGARPVLVAVLCAVALGLVGALTPVDAAEGQAGRGEPADPPSELLESFPLGKRSRRAGAPAPAPRRATPPAAAADDPASAGAFPLVALACGTAALAALGLASAAGHRRRRTRRTALQAIGGGVFSFATPVATPVATVSRSRDHRSRDGLEAADRASVEDLLALRGGDADAERGPDTAVEAFKAGVLLEREGDLAGAEQAYVHGDQAGSTDAAFNLGILLHRRGDQDRAESAYRRAIERGDTDAAFNLGVLRYERGDLAGAETEWRRCDRAGSAEGAANLGHLLERQGDLEAAGDAYRRAEERGDPAVAGRLRAISAHRETTRAQPPLASA